MPRFERRVKKLEGHFTDRNGLVPYTQQWRDHWAEMMEELSEVKTWMSSYLSNIGGYDLKSPADRAFSFDYDGNGRMDHIGLYRPGTGTIWILQEPR